MTLRARVDEDLCMGAGNCLHLARGAFVLNDEGIAEVVEGAEVTDEALRMAERSCPTAAIIVAEDGEEAA